MQMHVACNSMSIHVIFFIQLVFIQAYGGGLSNVVLMERHNHNLLTHFYVLFIPMYICTVPLMDGTCTCVVKF